MTLADLVECDNGDVESGNALLRRKVKAALQQRLLDLQALSMFWVIGDAKAEMRAVWGTGSPRGAYEKAPDDPQSGDDDETHTRMGGGGGAYQAFISKKKDEMRDEHGKVDFGTAGALWKFEKAWGYLDQNMPEYTSAGKKSNVCIPKQVHC